VSGQHHSDTRTEQLPLASSDPPDGPEVAGLAREVEVLRRDLRGMRARVEQMASVLAVLAESKTPTRSGTSAAAETPSWLDAPSDPGRPAENSRAARDAERLLAKLASWVGGIYLRYSDARGLPECWLWHPDVVEELLWLHAAWLDAHQPDVPVNAVGDWHDRQRPGVVKRIREFAGLCSLENHLPGAEMYVRAPVAPIADAVPVIAAWWAVARADPAPVPSDEQLSAARRLTPRGMRR
jgi:hypothetical protein